MVRRPRPGPADRADLEQYIRWMQEACRFKPSTISRRFSVAAGFYRTCVIDGVLEHSPAEHVRRPRVSAESPTLGFTHLQFEALLTASRESANRYDFALVAMLGLLGLRIFEATGADIADLGEEHDHRVLRVCGKGTKVVLVPLPPAVGRSIDRAVAGRVGGPILLNSRGTRMDRHAATRRLRPARCPDRRPACRSPHHHALRPCPQEPRPVPQLHPRRLHGLWHLTPPCLPSYRLRETPGRSSSVAYTLDLHVANGGCGNRPAGHAVPANRRQLRGLPRRGRDGKAHASGRPHADRGTAWVTISLGTVKGLGSGREGGRAV
jgi:hypothetical protein